jgi:hypothetical protein
MDANGNAVPEPDFGPGDLIDLLAQHRAFGQEGFGFDWILETNPLAYFSALVGLSKIVGVQADVSHRDGSKPRSIDEILQKVEEQTGKEGRAAFEKFLARVRPTE